ncbi:hypothetical protein OUZ56_028500 [Daphnia magna]|uniref:Uncharacterized protein n=1 Tax=Daphnia magna TaxID=35525 RepID=A0ABR0B420_9CRUS|nr:hypothetical protein OUZ56_028500 [Daphnia magna]
MLSIILLQIKLLILLLGSVWVVAACLYLGSQNVYCQCENCMVCGMSCQNRFGSKFSLIGMVFIKIMTGELSLAAVLRMGGLVPNEYTEIISEKFSRV